MNKMISNIPELDKALVVFQGKIVRRLWYSNEWYYSVIDVVKALTDSSNPRNYWNMLKSRELEHEVDLYTICVQLKMSAPDGKMQEKMQSKKLESR